MKKSAFLSLIIFILSNSLYADWVKITSHPNYYVNNVLISGSTIYSASFSGINRSTDGGLTWQALNNGLNNQQAIQCKEILITGSGFYAATVDGIYKSVNNGENWVKKSDGIIVGNGAIYAFAESIYEHNGSLFTGAYTGIYRSANGGENWIATNITGMHIWAKNFTLYNGVIFAAREAGNVPGSYKSTDKGITWQPFSIQSTYLPAITFYNDGPRLYAGTITGVFVSTNNGLSWIEKNSGLSPDPYSSSILRVNNVLITSLKFGGSGMFISYNNGDQWQGFSQGLPFLNEISKIVQFNSKLIIGTSGGLYERNISELTAIVQLSNETPSRFDLNQNYPNPFNPQTNIRFNVPPVSENSFINLIVYDVAGKECAVLVNNKLQPGTYQVMFDGSDFPSGAYFYTLTAGNFKETKKMVLVK